VKSYSPDVIAVYGVLVNVKAGLGLNNRKEKDKGKKESESQFGRIYFEFY